MPLADLSDNGRFGVLAIDHRDSMRAVLPSDVTDAAITGIKRNIVSGLADLATGVMLEPEFSIPQLLDCLPDGVGFTAALESQGYAADPESHIVSVLWSPAEAAASGASAAKLLVPYRPDRPNAPAQLEAAAQILADCRSAGIDLLLEPLFYNLEDPAMRPNIVHETVDHFVALEPDLLKLPFPIDASIDNDPNRWHAACQEITNRCPMPWTLLSGGGDYETYRDQLAVALDAGCSGFMVGRALWAPAIAHPEAVVSLLRPRLTELRSLL